MKRVIVDTNIYGRIIREGDTDFVISRIGKSGVIVYGCDDVRKEMRKMSKGKLEYVKGRAKKLRPLILGLYALLIKSHEISVTQGIRELAEAYFVSYRTAGGSAAKDKIMTDLVIVAAAAKKGLDVVYSDDNDTMLSKEAKTAYSIVNSIRGEKTPNFRSYGGFKNDIS
ncbi:MAG: hypothetical protein J4469_05275 [Candidatus Aenigmarchaeota archaeon]|nr:hypothetical protein [Candidatus Aenigmarchaeota archaeon]